MVYIGHIFSVILLLINYCNVYGSTSYNINVQSPSIYVNNVNKLNILHSNPKSTNVLSSNIHILKNKSINKNKSSLLDISMKERIRLILTLYGRNNSLILNRNRNIIWNESQSETESDADSDADLQPFNLEELFEWTLKTL